MKIAIGGVVRNRAWVLPDYLAALNSLDHYDKEYIFLENDSVDDTLNVLFKTEMDGIKYIAKYNTGEPGWDRNGEQTYSKDGYANLATVRNEFVERFLEWSDSPYLFSVDSDIIVQPDTLTKLLQEANQETIVGAAISNVPHKELDGVTPGNFMIELNGSIYHPIGYPLAGTMDVFVTGAVYLIPRKVLEAGVRYGRHNQGEDVAFCLEAEEKGFKRKVVLDAKCEHRMKRR